MEFEQLCYWSETMFGDSLSTCETSAEMDSKDTAFQNMSMCVVKENTIYL